MYVPILKFIDILVIEIFDLKCRFSVTAVPKCKKNFFKFWWDSDMDELKEKSIASCKLWKDAGKPRSGSIFTIYRRDKALYKNNIRTRQGKEREYFTNDPHEAILKKQGTVFGNVGGPSSIASKAKLTLWRG